MRVPQQLCPPYKDWRVNARIDHTFNSKHNISATYGNQSSIGLNDQATQQVDLTQSNFTKNRLILANVSLNSSLSSSTVNAATVGYQYWNNLIDSDQKTTTFTFPTGIGFGTNVNVPQQSYQIKYQFKDDLSVNRESHLQDEADYLWEPKLGGFFEFNPTLEIDFVSLPSACETAAGILYSGQVGGMTATAGNPYFNLPGGENVRSLLSG